MEQVTVGESLMFSAQLRLQGVDADTLHQFVEEVSWPWRSPLLACAALRPLRCGVGGLLLAGRWRSLWSWTP